MAFTNADVLIESYKKTGLNFWERKWSFWGLTFLLYYIPTVLWQIVLVALLSYFGIDTEEFSATTAQLVVLFLVYVFGLLVVIVTNTLLYLAVIKGSVSKRPIPMLKSVQKGMPRFFPYIGLSVILLLIFLPIFAIGWGLPIVLIAGAISGHLNWIAAALGAFFIFVIMLVPTIYLGTKLFFSSWSLAIDDLGVFDSIKSSWEFVRGRFWWTILYVIVFFVVYGLVTTFFLLFYVLLEVLRMAVNFAVPLLGDVLYVIFSGVISAILLPLVIVYLTQLYQTMKKVKKS